MPAEISTTLIIGKEMPDNELAERWTGFVEEHPAGNIFQTPAMHRVFSAVKNYTPLAILAFEGNEIAGVIVSVIQKEYKGIPGYLSSRCIVWGGPLVKGENENIALLLLQRLEERVKNTAIYIQCRNLHPQTSLSGAFTLGRYSYHPHLNILIDISQTFEELKAGIHPSRLRNLAKAVRKRLVIRELTDLNSVEQGYALTRQTYRRVKIPSPDITLFRSLFNNLSESGELRCYGAFLENRMVGFRMALLWNGMMHDYYAGSDPAHNNIYPNDALILNLLETGCSDKRLKTFDFGGAGKPGLHYGVRDHKLKFGGVLVEYGRYMRVNNKPLYNISLLGYRMWRAVSNTPTV